MGTRTDLEDLYRRSHSMTSQEADVIEAAQEFITLGVAAQYGPVTHKQYLQHLKALRNSVVTLQGECEGYWSNPT